MVPFVDGTEPLISGGETRKSMPKVWNKHDPTTPSDAVYVGRPSKWGNPYKMYGETARQPVIDAYRSMLLHESTNPKSIYHQMRKVREELKGKDLVCWCAPKSCHADILLEIANSD